MLSRRRQTRRRQVESEPEPELLEFTLQEALGRFGARWACYATACLNIPEYEREKIATEMERLATMGKWFYTESVLMANYKDHKNWSAEKEGWDEEADPEWHFLVVLLNEAIKDAMYILGVTTLKYHYEFHVLGTPYGNHFVLYNIDTGVTVNPDPSLSGEVIDKRFII